MKMRETIDVAVQPLEVWPLVSVPERMAQWNPKIVSVDRRSGQPLRLGERFGMVYEMSRRQRETEVEVTELQAAERVVFRHYFSNAAPRRFADESYQLIAKGAATRVEQAIDLRGTGIPRVLGILICFIHRFGWSSEGRSLARLKETAEAGGVAV